MNPTSLDDLGGTMLVIEDSDDDFEMFQYVVARCPTRPRVVRAVDAESCLSALERAGARTDAALPRVIVLDLNLPGMTGAELLEHLKAHPSLRDIPVVIYTTSTNPVDLRRCLRSHANAYHEKLMDIDAMEAQVRTMVQYWSEQVRLPVPARAG